MVASVSGRKIVRAVEKGLTRAPEKAGVNLAQKLLAMGASQFIAEVSGQ